jgi:sulfatase maturation enzyme AslB (radical SAM superfamily)
MSEQINPPTPWLLDSAEVGQLLMLAEISHEAEVTGDPLWPSDFNSKTADIYTNTLCDHECDYCFFSTANLKDRNMMSLSSLDRQLAWLNTGGSPVCFATWW